MHNKTKLPLIQNTYPDYHQNGSSCCNTSNTIVPDYYPNPQFSDKHYHIHHPHHCCENRYPEVIDRPACNGDCGSCYSYQQMNCIKQDLVETENIEYRVPILEKFPWQETVKSKITKFLPIRPSKGDRYLIYFPREDDDTSSDDQTENDEILEDPESSVDHPDLNNPEEVLNNPSCSCPCVLLTQYRDSIIWYDGKHWNVNRPSAGWTVYIEDEKLRYVYHPDTGWLVDNNNPNGNSHASNFYYSNKSEVVFAELEIV